MLSAFFETKILNFSSHRWKSGDPGMYKTRRKWWDKLPTLTGDRGRDITNHGHCPHAAILTFSQLKHMPKRFGRSFRLSHDVGRPEQFFQFLCVHVYSCKER